MMDPETGVFVDYVIQNPPRSYTKIKSNTQTNSSQQKDSHSPNDEINSGHINESYDPPSSSQSQEIINGVYLERDQ